MVLISLLHCEASTLRKPERDAMIVLPDQRVTVMASEMSRPRLEEMHGTELLYEQSMCHQSSIKIISVQELLELYCCVAML